MRIGIDARLIYYQRAGIASYIVGLLQGIASLNTKHEYLVLKSRKDREDLKLPSNFHYRSLWTPCHHRFERIALATELFGVELDVLHSPDFIPPERIFGNRKSVITVHDLAYLKYPEVLTPESQRYYGQIGPAVEEADAVIAVSENTKRDLMALLDAPESKIVVIPEAPDELFEPNKEPTTLHEMIVRLRIRQPYFLVVGTIEPKKNLGTLLRAYGKLREIGRSANNLPELVVAGREGWLFKDVFSLVEELRLSDHVHFLGPVTQRDLVLLYSGAMALTYPSLYEGFGLPILEAMACGCPVITSNISSLPEVAGEDAITIDPRDIDALTQALNRIWSSPELRADLRRKGIARAKLFSWRKTAEATLHVYESLA